MPVWMTSTGIWGSVSILPEDRIVDKQQNSRVVPGFRLPLQRAWMTTEFEPDDGFAMPSKVSFSRVAPEYIDTDNLPAGVTMDLNKAALYRPEWKKDPLKALEAWLDSDMAKQLYSFERGDPRGQRPVKMVMTAADHAKFLEAKEAGVLDIDEAVTTPPVETGAQKIRRGVRTADG